jgi:alpha-tubulin suppressor-like RCC1 family protein
MRFDATNVAEISAGRFHSAVLRTNGDLYVFGYNDADNWEEAMIQAIVIHTLVQYLQLPATPLK